jgi:hypothetical protein
VFHWAVVATFDIISPFGCSVSLVEHNILLSFAQDAISLRWSDCVPHVPQLNNRRLILFPGQPQLCGHIWIPLDHRPTNSGLCVAQLDDRLIFMQIPQRMHTDAKM